MSPLLNEASKVRLGSEVVDRIYHGSTRLWPEFLLTDIPGLVSWHDASQLALADGAAVSPWPNLVAGGSSGVISGSPAPTKRDAQRNGLPVVRFINGQGIVSVTSGSGIAAEYTCFVVAHLTGTANSRVFGSASLNFLIGWWGGYMDCFHLDGWSTPNPSPAATTAWKMYSFDGTATVGCRFFSNGTLLSTLTGTKNFSGTYSIGGSLGENSACEVAEVIWYNNKISDANRQKVEAYLRTKWGF